MYMGSNRRAIRIHYCRKLSQKPDEDKQLLNRDVVCVGDDIEETEEDTKVVAEDENKQGDLRSEKNPRILSSGPTIDSATDTQRSILFLMAVWVYFILSVMVFMTYLQFECNILQYIFL